VKVSWSSWDETSWRRINRPPPDLHFDQVTEGIRRFAADFPGQLWVEVFVVPGLNDSPFALKSIATQVNELGASRIHLNTATRPPADPTVRPASFESLRQAAALFNPPAEIPEESALLNPSLASGSRSGLREAVLRHPATAAQLATLLGRPESEISRELEQWVATGELRRILRDGQVWYGPPS